MAAMIKDRYDINNKYYLPQLVINYINLPKSHPHFIEEKPLKLRLPIYRDNIKQESIFKEYHSSCNIVNQPYGKFKYKCNKRSIIVRPEATKSLSFTSKSSRYASKNFLIRL